MHELDLDEADLRLLEAVQRDGRLTHAQLSEGAGLSPSQCQRRLRRLESAGVIRAYVALVEARAVGIEATAFVNVTLSDHARYPVEAFTRAVERHPQVLECWAVMGESDYVLRVAAPDLEGLSTLLLQDLSGLPMVATVRAQILLERVKELTALPIRP